MLTSDVKRRIDAARDVLVGVAPNPTTQIEQITFALIYKFMHDMDQSAVKAGGEASFFTGTLKKYSWDKVLDSRLGNHEKLALYAEALEKFTEAKQLPELFRSIFRSAYLPYKSPETLGLFLKEMNYFDYTHPEELGNAYEYLLSIMSSQGDAGQFRTPRHIIDFMVDVINPSKDDRILDPACGTGGFLISSYKHILEQHDGKNDPKKKEKPLTPDDRKKLMANLEGYDIDPTMVRISQVNMYLHQFKNPQIFQYDTLTSEERWNEKYDVILANPPFMSPRGGIRPHNKFGVTSNRAEVLFVDYIINHLKPKGRAGIVVPEGINFQAGNAYKALRKNLVENGLYAVVSLPGGVFQPYSGVKTSILLIDNELAKNKSDIAFVKISADGFDLGSSKRAIEKNDLPIAVELLRKFQEGTSTENPVISYVSKHQIAESGDYSLSGDQFKLNSSIRNSGWPLVPLGELVDILNGFAFKSDLYTDKGIRVIRITNVQKGYVKDDEPKYYPESARDEISKYKLKENDLLVSLTGNVGRVALLPASFLPAALNQRVACLRINDNSQILDKYLFHLLNLDNFEEECINASRGVAQKNLSTEWLKTFEIPLPPLEVQAKIVTELDGYAAIISGAKQITNNWKASIDVKPHWPRVPLKDICELVNGRAYNQDELLSQGKYRVLRVGNFFSSSSWYYSDMELDRNKYCERGDLLYAWSASFGARIWEEEKVIYHYHIWKVINDKSRVSRPFLKVLLEQLTGEFKAQGGRGGTMMHLTKSGMESTLVPIPTLEEQDAIVKGIEIEQNLVDASNQLIKMYEDKINNVVSGLWNAAEEAS